MSPKPIARLLPWLALAALTALAGCGSDSSSSSSVASYSIGGTVSGLSGSGMYLQLNSTYDLSVSANGSFSFGTQLRSGTSYTVRVYAHPSSPAQICTVSNATGTVSGTVSNIAVGCTSSAITGWSHNLTSTNSYISGTPLTGVQTITTSTIGNVGYTNVTTTGIPAYSITLTASGDRNDVSFLGASNRGSGDWDNISGTVVLGATFGFGQDIGFNSSACTLGFWPPGPACPSDQALTAAFRTSATAASTHSCSTSLGPMGLFLNGVAVYDWQDGASYRSSTGNISGSNGDGVWHSVAGEWELYDLDICLGHSTTSGSYHHHTHSNCLASTFSDTGTGHSPVYGYAADGYPIRGPFASSNTYVLPSWRARDYSTTSGGGCGTAGARTCTLADQTSPGGSKTTATTGPTTSASVNSLSGIAFTAVSGMFYEDYYIDTSRETLAASSSLYVDRYNGHDHDNLGYHYHVTVQADSTTGVGFDPIFPYFVGPTFYGALPSKSTVTNSLVNCSQS